MFRVRLKSQRAEVALSNLDRGANNLRPLMADLSEYLLQATQERFTSETDPSGVPWTPLSERHLAAKARRGENLGILKMTGTMFDELNADFTDNTAAIVSDLIQSATQQFGDDSRNIPAREFLGISNQDEDEIIAIVEGFLFDLAA